MLNKDLICKITEKLFFSSPEELWPYCQVVIILGSSACEYRVARTWDLFGDKNVLYIVCGGNRSVYKDASGNSYTEAAFMQAYLLAKGVPAERIITEMQSLNTFENLQNAFKILPKKYFGSVGIISAGFHMSRVKSLCEKLPVHHDLVFIPAYGVHTRKDNWFANEVGLQIVTAEYTKSKINDENGK